MNDNAKKILSLIEQYMNENPNLRFTQILFNLGINQFGGDNTTPGGSSYLLRDCYYDSDTDVLKRMAEQYKPRFNVDSILIVMAAENNEEAKFHFSKPEITFKELEEYNWLQKVLVTDEATVEFINKIVNRKNNAVLHCDYEWTANDREDERKTIHKAALLNGMTDFKLDALRDLGDVRCYLLLQEMDKYTLHTGFEKRI